MITSGTAPVPDPPRLSLRDDDLMAYATPVADAVGKVLPS